ncbi:MAG: N-acetyl-gamma-glutamyl-phosphate reductase [Dehalococcoidales bacterium]|nr:N-acetyl-gamma-glutamyl-phosphate reductase [Dehalococcoidales bacterium]MDZ4230417.1 N-acetyl-gamma-glutamyl-phosphate reductase [Dehalococcoidales bacterium]
MSKTRVGIINVTGYAGVELARLLYRHPEAELTSVTGRSAAGQKLGKVFPHLASIDLTIQPELEEVDIAFSAMPHKDSAKEVVPLLQKGVKVVDISADFRLKDAAEYPAWYGFTHPAPELLTEAVFGLPELYYSRLTSARLVANPGCYPTGAILALAPAVKAGLIEPDIIIDSKSGVSGAGRTLSLTTHYPETNEDVSAYALDGHRHQPEIAQELKLLSPRRPPSVTFIPHLIPMTRGILTTAYATLSPGKIAAGEKGKQELRDLYLDFYRDKPFARIAESSPHTKHTWGNNLCLIYPTISRGGEKLIVISCLDNLVKGAAGQAIQNMNIMLGLPETTGLEALAVFP